MRLEVKQRRDRQWFVRLVAGNRRVLWHTEGYTRKSGAVRAARKRAAELRGHVPVRVEEPWLP